ncbi:MAG: hypothetical protein MHMPM18_003620 [Marteilia pararefringens]
MLLGSSEKNKVGIRNRSFLLNDRNSFLLSRIRNSSESLRGSLEVLREFDVKSKDREISREIKRVGHHQTRGFSNRSKVQFEEQKPTFICGSESEGNDECNQIFRRSKQQQDARKVIARCLLDSILPDMSQKTKKSIRNLSLGFEKFEADRNFEKHLENVQLVRIEAMKDYFKNFVFGNDLEDVEEQQELIIKAEDEIKIQNIVKCKIESLNSNPSSILATSKTLQTFLKLLDLRGSFELIPERFMSSTEFRSISHHNLQQFTARVQRILDDHVACLDLKFIAVLKLEIRVHLETILKQFVEWIECGMKDHKSRRGLYFGVKFEEIRNETKDEKSWRFVEPLASDLSQTLLSPLEFLWRNGIEINIDNKLSKKKNKGNNDRFVVKFEKDDQFMAESARRICRASDQIEELWRKNITDFNHEIFGENQEISQERYDLYDYSDKINDKLKSSEENEENNDNNNSREENLKAKDNLINISLDYVAKCRESLGLYKDIWIQIGQESRLQYLMESLQDECQKSNPNKLCDAKLIVEKEQIGICDELLRSRIEDMEDRIEKRLEIAVKELKVEVERIGNRLEVSSSMTLDTFRTFWDYTQNKYGEDVENIRRCIEKILEEYLSQQSRDNSLGKTSKRNQSMDYMKIIGHKDDLEELKRLLLR